MSNAVMLACQFLVISFDLKVNTVVRLYMDTLTSGQPSYAATILENKLLINPVNLPFTNGQPSHTAIFDIIKGKRGTTVYVIFILPNVLQYA